MSKPLFDNVGKELKIIAEITAKYIIFLHVLIGLPLIIIGCALFAEDIPIVVGIVLLLAGVGIILYGFSSARLQIIKLYAYGELVEKVVSIEGKLVGKNGSARNDGEKKKVIKKVVPAPKTEKNPDGSWQCIFCDHTNPAGADWCEDCGVQANFE